MCQPAHLRLGKGSVPLSLFFQIPSPAWTGRHFIVTLLCAEQLDQISQTQAGLGNAMPRWHAAIQAGAYYVAHIQML